MFDVSVNFCLGRLKSMSMSDFSFVETLLDMTFNVILQNKQKETHQLPPPPAHIDSSQNTLSYDCESKQTLERRSKWNSHSQI